MNPIVPIAAFLVLSFTGPANARAGPPHASTPEAAAVDSRIRGKGRAISRGAVKTDSASRPLCKPPDAAPKIPSTRKRPSFALLDTTPPTPPGSLQVFRESIHSVFVSWQAASDPESGIDYYAFALGGAPGATDITWWQSTGTALSSYAKSLNELALSEGDTIHISVKAYNGAGMPSIVVNSGPIVLQYEPLGEATNELTVDFAGGWSAAELSDLQWFLGRMLPIIKNIYGPPSHSYAVTLVRNLNYSSTAVFFSGPNEIHMDGLHPQLLTHEIIHAFRDNVGLSSNPYWHYDPTLSGFEEGFAQAISYSCMNRYAELYPADPIVPSGVLYLSDYDWDYDYQNTDILTTTDYWSDGAGTGIYWLRYEMGAAAIIKISKAYSTFARDFNSEYYARLNADHALTPSRGLMREVVSQVAPSIEGRTANEWIDRQHIFDCVIRPGHKIWVRTQHYPGWNEYLIFQRVFYYETFSNGSEWAYWDTGIGDWIYHSLNGSAGSAVLRDWTGNIVANKSLTIEPIDNPPVFLGFGNAEVNLSTDNDIAPWPGGDPADFMLDLNDFGLYRLELSFGGDATEVVRLMGDTLRSTRGVFGAVLNASTGTLFLDHEDFPNEPPVPVVNGVFHAERAWASVANPSTGYADSQPGRVVVTYIDDDGSEYSDRRNIDYGSWSGTQLFLFDTQTMTPVTTGIAHIALDAPVGGENLQPGGVFTITWHVLLSHNLQNWDLWYSTAGANGPWTAIAIDLAPGSNAAESVHTFDWVVPQTPSSQVRIRVRMDNSGADYEVISSADLTIDTPSAVNLSYFTAQRRGYNALLQWQIVYATDHLGFHVYREEPGGVRERISADLVKGSMRYDFRDETAPVGQATYWLEEIEVDGSSNWYGPANLSAVPSAERVLSLAPTHPNPFNPTTTIHYTLPQAGRVVLTVYDTRGARITTLVDEVQTPGAHSLQWSGRGDREIKAASGVYFLRLQFGKHVRHRKVILLK